MQSLNKILTAAAMLAIVAGCNKTANDQANAPANASKTSDSANSNDPIASAESAAPAAVAHAAAIVSPQPDGTMKVLRAGSGIWTCMPDSPATPGPDPMCFDKNAATWADAWVHHKPPPTDAAGVIYMLEGGTDASNIDPYATKPTANNDWVKTGPHIMIVGSKAVLAGYPAGAKPDTSAPSVMWAGTPYAHLMVPVTR